MSFPLPPLEKRKDTDFEVGEILGRGNFVSVYRAVDLTNGKSCALKIVDRYRASRLKKTQDLEMEKHCLRRTNHVNIVKMLAHFTDTLCVYVVLEECLGGELWDKVKYVGCPLRLGQYYLAQVVNAIEYLRQAGIVHRDLKAENVMLTESQTIKLIDFGTAKDLENPHIKGSGQQSRHKVWENYVGTPQFMPPEVIENKFTDHRSDTWSLGCLFYQVMAGVPPFHAGSEYLVFTKIVDRGLEYPPGMNEQVVDLISKMVVKDADARLGASDIDDIRRHAFFVGVRHKRIHERPAPKHSLADLCLHQVGRNVPAFREQLASWPGLEQLAPELKGALQRVQVVHDWLDAAMPKDHDS